MNTLFRIISAVQRTASNACQSNGVHHSLRKGAIGRYFNDPPAARNIGCTPLSADVGHISSQSCWCKKQNTSSLSICLVSTTLLAVIFIFLEMFFIGFLFYSAISIASSLALALPFLDLPATNWWTEVPC